MTSRRVRALRLSRIVIGVGALLGGPARADDARPVQHHVGASLGGGYFGSDRRVAAGAGGSLTYRLELVEHWNVSARIGVYTLLGTVASGALGGTYAWRVSRWTPALGVEAAMLVGDSVRVLDSRDPVAVGPAAFSVRAVVQPLRFRWEALTVQALGASIGPGFESGALAFDLTLIGLEVRFPP